MQRGSRSISTLPENLSFSGNSMSRDAGIDSQLSLNNMQTSALNWIPDFRISSSEANIHHLRHVRNVGLDSEWSLGEASSGPTQGDHDGRKMETYNVLSQDTVDINANGNHGAGSGSTLLQISGSEALTQDLNMPSDFGDNDNDDCQAVERPDAYMSTGSSSRQLPSSDSFELPSGHGGYVSEESEDRPDCSSDGRRISCKRKALEVHAGQSSELGYSTSFQHAERSQFHALPSSARGTNLSTPIENNLVINDRLEQANPRLRLGGGTATASPFSLTAPGTTRSSHQSSHSQISQSSHQNSHSQISHSYQQDLVPRNPFFTGADIGNADISFSHQSSQFIPHNHLFDSYPTPAVETASLHRLRVPSVHRNPQSRWAGASSSRTRRSPASAISGETLYDEPAARNVNRSILEHPMFVPADETGSSSQQPATWNLEGGTDSFAGHVASTSRMGSTSRAAPTLSHRNCPEYPPRVSESVRRSLSSSAGNESGRQCSSNHAIRLRSLAASRERALSLGSGNHGNRMSNSSSALLERHINRALGAPDSLRSLAAAGEGRSSIIMSEQIRRVLDLMRRGEGLRFEDMMILDNSIFSGMADIHDRHRDMRLDVDNMSYEELLALEERIGNVCTGLSEETIASRLKQQKYVADSRRAEDSMEIEPCSICREEYHDGEVVGTLECGHEFHADCIKQWLMHKNLCPICKTTGLTA